jgi:hypothetical protein
MTDYYGCATSDVKLPIRSQDLLRAARRLGWVADFLLARDSELEVIASMSRLADHHHAGNAGNVKNQDQ